MDFIPFKFGDRATVPGYLGLDVQAEVLAHILEVQPDKILLVSDHTVEALHGDYLAPLARNMASCGEPGSPHVEKFLLPAGDACKSWDNLTQLMKWAFSVGASKRSLIVAFGGGALMNVTGLFASILYRGTKLVYIPTTLLAMHDVTTSLKTSICFDGRKNNIGSFYAPLKILMDIAFCRTLPRGELFSGIGELAKNATLLGGKHSQGFVEALSNNRINHSNAGCGGEFTLDDESLKKLLALGIEAKMTMLVDDAYEKTTAMIFEYGHTMSHALEKSYGDGILPHGIGVVYGMLSSSYVAEKLGFMNAKDRQHHDELCWLLLNRWPLPEPKPFADKVISLALRDSKRGLCAEADDEISDVLLCKIGDVIPTKTNMLSKFPVTLVKEWLISMDFTSETKKTIEDPAPTLNVLQSQFFQEAAMGS